MNALLLLLALASDPIPRGSSRLELDIDGTKLEVFVHKPESYAGERLLVVMHGVNRNADEYRDHAVELGQRYCVYIEIHGEDAYCALGRGGIGIVSLFNPASPVLYKILDTPGVAAGIVFRPDGLNDVQMVVGDARAGMRLYGRPAPGGFTGDGDNGGGAEDGGGQ